MRCLATLKLIHAIITINTIRLVCQICQTI